MSRGGRGAGRPPRGRRSAHIASLQSAGVVRSWRTRDPRRDLRSAHSCSQPSLFCTCVHLTGSFCQILWSVSGTGPPREQAWVRIIWKHVRQITQGPAYLPASAPHSYPVPGLLHVCHLYLSPPGSRPLPGSPDCAREMVPLSKCVRPALIPHLARGAGCTASAEQYLPHAEPEAGADTAPVTLLVPAAFHGDSYTWPRPDTSSMTAQFTLFCPPRWTDGARPSRILSHGAPREHGAQRACSSDGPALPVRSWGQGWFRRLRGCPGATAVTPVQGVTAPPLPTQAFQAHSRRLGLPLVFILISLRVICCGMSHFCLPHCKPLSFSRPP